MNKWEKLDCFYEEDCIFKGLELSWEEGEQIGFWGYSGCGKTSLLKLIAKKLREEEKKIAYVFQHEVLLEWLTVEENIFLVNPKLLQGEYQKIISVLKLEEEQKKYPKELSGGLRKRVALARAFAYDADYLLLDEAFEFLDLAIQEDIFCFLQREQERSRKTIFLVTHQIETMLRLAEKVFFFAGEKPVKELRMHISKEKEETRKRLEEEICHI